MSTNILFIHHSTGGYLLQQGKVRELLLQKNKHLQLWDHGYNLDKNLVKFPFLSYLTFKTGLSNPLGLMTGRDFNVNISNDSPEGYVKTFSQKPTDSTLSQILKFDIIIFKNCYPTTKITSDEQLTKYQNYYQTIFKYLKKYPNKLFIVFTSPPLRSELTKPEYAIRARKLSDWVVAHQSRNIKTFDFFDLLSDSSNTLKRQYCRFLPFDSHPNKLANQTIAPILVNVLDSVSQQLVVS
ncbi:MAG: hypothetical protein WAV41_01905 [Microgenomates group bacterium]